MVRVGISIHPGQVIVGLNGWLHLGDDYGQTLSDDRRPPDREDEALAAKIKLAADAWRRTLRIYGVREYLVMVGPNKGAVYSETMPKWARATKESSIDALLANPGPDYLDLRPALLSTKSNTPAALYYSTDTHWNMLGAAAAFRAFSDRVGRDQAFVKWPGHEAYRVSGMAMRQGGDLARFLYLDHDVTDPDPKLGVENWPTTVVQRDWRTGKTLSTGSNLQIQTPSVPVLVESSGALNHVRVLWLRDSFGVALSPFMAATFSDVLQIHWRDGFADGALLKLVERFKPDYVFVTVVQRDARSQPFATPPD